jgi:hypothetical protein
VFVNLESGTATLQVIRRIPLFSGPAQRFIIDSDSGGFSAIEKREDGYYEVNYLRGEDKPLDEKKLTEEDVRSIIRSVLKERYMLAVRG